MLEAVRFENKLASDVLRARFLFGVKLDINISSAPRSVQREEAPESFRGQLTLHISLYPKGSFSGEISAIRP
jgi:hypothetical protein